MFRKIMIAVVASLALMAPLAIPSETQAREVHRTNHGRTVRNRPVHGRSVHYRGNFQVLYRAAGCDAWSVRGNYGNRGSAIRAANRLHSRGFQEYVR